MVIARTLFPLTLSFTFVTQLLGVYVSLVFSKFWHCCQHLSNLQNNKAKNVNFT